MAVKAYRIMVEVMSHSFPVDTYSESYNGVTYLDYDKAKDVMIDATSEYPDCYMWIETVYANI